MIVDFKHSLYLLDEITWDAKYLIKLNIDHIIVCDKLIQIHVGNQSRTFWSFTGY